jgi:hypothetical protein
MLPFSFRVRRCFPCWDEPRRKATFTCSLRVPSHMVALSNMPESMVHDHGDGYKTVAFMPTPRMSTYLLGESSALPVRGGGRGRLWVHEDGDCSKTSRSCLPHECRRTWRAE